jgi:hypothetical protein
MKTLFTLSALTLLFFTPTLSAQLSPKSIVVIFENGGKVEVIDWTFVYKYGDSDHQPSPQSISYYEQTKKTKELLIDFRGRERTILVENLSTIKFGPRTTKWGKVSDNITIMLVDGEVIEIDTLEPAKGLISKAERVFNTELHLEGRTKLGTFSKCLNFRGYGLCDIEPREKISELLFHSEH